MYDKRTANQLAKAKKATKRGKGSQFPKRVVELLQRHAERAAAHAEKAQLVSFHKRRQRTVWLLPGGQTLELRGSLA